jgi:hypothetical protein
MKIIEKMKQTSKIKVLVVAICSILAGCATNNPEDKLKDSLSIEQDTHTVIKKAKKIFYSLPSPLETAILFKQAGATYNKDLLNPLNNYSNYTTNKQMSLNLGIYSADLSYASLFEQNQTAIQYMAAAKKMAEGLGVIDAIDKSMIEKLEENVTNKAVVMEIVSQAFVNSNASLKQNDRASMASIVLVGGWIEGLYIATQLTNKAKDNELIDRIIDQRLSLESIISLLDAYKTNNDVADVLKDMHQLKEIFDQISVKTSKIVPVEDKNTKVTMLKSKKETSLSESVYKQLLEKTKNIRNKYIAG